MGKKLSEKINTFTAGRFVDFMHRPDLQARSTNGKEKGEQTSCVHQPEGHFRD